jgi:hypothetical protein
MQIIIDLEELDAEAIARLLIVKRALAENANVIAAVKAADPVASAQAAEPDIEQQDYQQVSDFAATVEAEAKDEDKPLDIEDVRAAMREVTSKIGTGAVIEIVKRHGAPSASKLDPSKYAAVIADCNAALANY